MNHHKRTFARLPLAAAVLLALPAVAQETTSPVATITVTGRTPAPAVSGFGERPLAETPVSARVLSDRQFDDAGTRQLADLVRFDAAVSDAYNAEGYWGNLTMRGYVLDNRFNYRRDGLPINAETAIALDNKAAVEVLKGTSGIQAGTSAPGGLVNYVVKRPDRNVRSATFGWRENGTLGAAADVSQRFGDGERYGLRVNAAAERLRPQTRSLHGERHLLALAGDVKLSRDTLLEAEIEHSRQSQPSVPGFSLRGDQVPDAHQVDPRINLNNQPWSQPVVFGAHTASLKLIHHLGGGWKATAHAMTQRLKTDDRLAFPFGCSAEGRFDRYCSDGSFDFYDFRSDNERRRSDALEVSLAGTLQTGTLAHRLTAGVLFSRFRSDLPRQAYNFLPQPGNDAGTAVVDPDPTLTTEALSRRDRSTEIYVRDAVRLDARNDLWLGLRHTRLERTSLATDGSRPADYAQHFTTPWIAFSHKFDASLLAYASFGHGIESRVVPFIPFFYGTAAGTVLPAQRSRQAELGLKGRTAQDLQWQVAAFGIEQPYARDTSAEVLIDGTQQHLGVEGQFERRSGAWQYGAGALLLRAQQQGSADAGLHGVRPANVPERSLRLTAARDVAALPGLTLQGWLVYEGNRTLLPAADSPRIGGWTRVDLAARYTQRLDGTQLTWRAGVDNALDRRAWRESPYQFNHVYLYPLAPRTWRASVQAEF